MARVTVYEEDLIDQKKKIGEDAINFLRVIDHLHGTPKLIKNTTPTPLTCPSDSLPIDVKYKWHRDKQCGKPTGDTTRRPNPNIVIEGSDN
jgi:hypothetical protein